MDETRTGDGGRCVLVSGTMGRDAIQTVCEEVIDPTTLPRTSVLAITFTGSLDSTAEFFDSTIGGLPGQLGVISLADGMRAAQESKTGFREVFDKEVYFASERPEDLTGLAILVNDYLQKWERARDSNTVDTLLVGFHSLSMLLQYVPADRAIRFLEAMTTALRRNGVTAYFLADPGVIDSAVLGQLEPHFDSVVALGTE